MHSVIGVYTLVGLMDAAQSHCTLVADSLQSQPLDKLLGMPQARSQFSCGCAGACPFSSLVLVVVV